MQTPTTLHVHAQVRQSNKPSNETAWTAYCGRIISTSCDSHILKALCTRVNGPVPFSSDTSGGGTMSAEQTGPQAACQGCTIKKESNGSLR